MKKSEAQNKILMKKQGVVVSDKMDKTVLVAVESYKTLKKYGKKYRSTRKYKAHDEKNQYKVGDKVEIVTCKPIGKGKKYKVV